jgi:hypothetical protein
MPEQLILLPLQGVRCAWCNRLVDPLSILQVRICVDPYDSDLVTGHEPVCNICLEPEPLEIELETDMITYRDWWHNGHKYEYIEGEQR